MVHWVIKFVAEDQGIEGRREVIKIQVKVRPGIKMEKQKVGGEVVHCLVKLKAKRDMGEGRRKVC